MRAEAAGDPGPWRQQAILGRRDWDADALRDIVRDYVIEHLADDDAVLVVDETGFLKQGKASCRVARQYTGSAGKLSPWQRFDGVKTRQQAAGRAKQIDTVTENSDSGNRRTDRSDTRRSRTTFDEAEADHLPRLRSAGEQLRFTVASRIDFSPACDDCCPSGQAAHRRCADEFQWVSPTRLAIYPSLPEWPSTTDAPLLGIPAHRLRDPLSKFPRPREPSSRSSFRGARSHIAAVVAGAIGDEGDQRRCGPSAVGAS